MKPLCSPLPSEFKRKRIQSGLSQKGLADLLGLHVNSIKGYESGRVKCSHITWGFMLARLNERNEETKERIAEHCRRWAVSQSYRNEWKRKARAEFGD